MFAVRLAGCLATGKGFSWLCGEEVSALAHCRAARDGYSHTTLTEAISSQQKQFGLEFENPSVHKSFLTSP